MGYTVYKVAESQTQLCPVLCSAIFYNLKLTYKLGSMLSILQIRRLSSRDVEQLPKARAPEGFPPCSLIGVRATPSMDL